MNKQEYIKKAEEILWDEFVIKVTPKDKKDSKMTDVMTKILAYDMGVDKHIKEVAQALYQLYLEGVREIIGEDEENGKWPLHQKPRIVYRNALRREQREKIK